MDGSSDQLIISDDPFFFRAFQLSLVYFIIAGLMGLLLRLAFITDLPAIIQYKYVLHAHSHVAIMGWIYNGLTILIMKYFNLRKKVFRKLFWLIQISVVGMMMSFPVQGYGMVSIFFTTMHMLVSYAFIYYTFKETGLQKQRGPEIILLKTALIFLFISTLGVWALGYIMNSALKGSAVYYGSIQFFLHFQFNGWFIFSILSILAKIFAEDIETISLNLKLKFYWLLTVSCIFTFTLAVTWSTPKMFLFVINSFGVILQFGAILFLYLIYKGMGKSRVNTLPVITLNMWKISAACFTVKILMQTLVAVPYLATISYTIKNFVIGFIHLLMLGTLSTFIIGCHHIFINYSAKGQNRGLILFIIGICVVEILLFLQGIFLWFGMGFIPWYYTLIFIFSAIMPLGILDYTIRLRKIRIS